MTKFSFIDEYIIIKIDSEDNKCTLEWLLEDKKELKEINEFDYDESLIKQIDNVKNNSNGNNHIIKGVLFEWLSFYFIKSELKGVVSLSKRTGRQGFDWLFYYNENIWVTEVKYRYDSFKTALKDSLFKSNLSNEKLSPECYSELESLNKDVKERINSFNKNLSMVNIDNIKSIKDLNIEQLKKIADFCTQTIKKGKEFENIALAIGSNQKPTPWYTIMDDFCKEEFKKDINDNYLTDFKKNKLPNNMIFSIIRINLDDNNINNFLEKLKNGK